MCLQDDIISKVSLLNTNMSGTHFIPGLSGEQCKQGWGGLSKAFVCYGVSVLLIYSQK